MEQTTTQIVKSYYASSMKALENYIRADMEELSDKDNKNTVVVKHISHEYTESRFIDDSIKESSKTTDKPKRSIENDDPRRNH